MNTLVVHRLKNHTLTLAHNDAGNCIGVLAECVCGWQSIHFSSFSASVAFQSHCEAQRGKDITDPDLSFLKPGSP
jgi:hypothetical protein